MDANRAEKLKPFNKNHNQNNTLVSYNLIAFLCVFCFCAEYWFPVSPYTSAKQFTLVSLPNIFSVLVQPKCLYVVANVIVVFLVGESRLVGSYSSSTPEIYEEYTQRIQSLRGHNSIIIDTQEKGMATKLSGENLQIAKHDYGR
ncbi:hypothetical protein L6164_015066 [Bauhinia variegata]|uniref:Uncharacterized protein n=1 Tax=Bauhinia variegata TaxID=167791 RepID=A0ACB9NJD2_BAUVA|nr:hypothetical protein L6164_015066 [Bauhinia variegata]